LRAVSPGPRLVRTHALTTRARCWFHATQRGLPAGTAAPTAAPTSAPTIAPTGADGALPPLPPPAGDFSIQLANLGDENAVYDAFMARAASRWEQIIIGDLLDIEGVPLLLLLEGVGVDDPNADNFVADIDDVVIFYE
jgi:hypothetical protein